LYVLKSQQKNLIKIANIQSKIKFRRNFQFFVSKFIDKYW
jgi:hypothetical protein